MRQYITSCLPILFFIISSGEFWAQKLTLKLFSKKNTDYEILKKIDFNSLHTNTASINKEIGEIMIALKNKGYFACTIEDISVKNNMHTAHFLLGTRITHAIIYKSKNNDSIIIPIEKLQPTLKTISKKLDDEGKSFSKVQLKNVRIKEKTLFANLRITQSKKRRIDKIIIKGYEKFSRSHIKYHLNVRQGELFSQKKILEISKNTKYLAFVKEIKPPEVLFTKDSTLLYIYLKKAQNNSFDGLVNFASKDDGGVLLNGNVNLILNNIINTGERLELFWNSIGEEKKELILSTEIPYIFNSKLSPQLSFSIYKQDSSFLNTRFDSKLSYNITKKLRLALLYNSESSTKLKDKNTDSIDTYTNYFLGLQVKYRVPKNDFLSSDKFNLEINPSLGKRDTKASSLTQLKISSSASYLWDLNLKNSIFIRNEIGYLNSDSYLNNELFRIGGLNTIRGFNEQSIYTSNYNYFNLEYRYLTSEKSYLYSITDLGRAKINLKNNTLFSIGLGYLFTTNNSQINLNISAGKISSKDFDLKKSKLNIKWVTFF